MSWGYSIRITHRVRRWQHEYDEGHRSSGSCRVPRCRRRPAYEIARPRAPWGDHSRIKRAYVSTRIVCSEHGRAFAARRGLLQQLELFAP